MRVAIALLIISFIVQTSKSYGEDSQTYSDCARSQCGCSKEIEIKYKTTILSSDLIPQQNIKVSCPEQGLLGISDKNGKVAFIIKTTISPGCGLGCGGLTFERESSTSYEAWYININFPATSNFSNKEQTILGQYYQKGERKQNENDGLWQEWCLYGLTGQLRVSGRYKQGLKDGEWTEWHCTGQKKSQGKYRYGKKEGVWKEWYDSDNGLIQNQTEWHDDKWHGKMISWYPNGQIESESEFRDGKYYGVRKYYSRDGKTVYIEYMDSDGNIINTEKKSNKSVQ